MVKKSKYLLIFCLIILLMIIRGDIINFPRKELSSALAENNIQAFQDNLIANNNNSSFQQILNSNRSFAFNLFKQTFKRKAQNNLLISPTSISLALSLLYNGASDATKAEMTNTLELQGLNLTDVNKSYQKLINILQTQEDVNLLIANSLWLKDNFAIQPSFLENNQQYYQAKITELDFELPEAKNLINNWVKESTQGKIDSIIDDIKPEDVLFIINAIYFQGKWQTQFNPDLTKTQSFHSANGQTSDYPLMTQQGKFAYYETDDFQIVSLPYGQSGDISMYILLPQEEISLETFVSQINSQTWQEWQKRLEDKQGLIALPKFSLEDEIDLNNILQDLGMKKAFTNQADFRDLTENKVKVSQVKHKTFLELNEQGTEASASTSIGISLTSLSINQPFQMIINRPFLYLIQDNQTNTILFIGTVQNLNPEMAQ